MADYPWFKFYPTDWRSDPALRMCSIAARGLWIEMIALMHEAVPYGHLIVSGQSPTDTQLAVLAGTPSDQIPGLICELESAGVFSRTKEGVIFSRKMTRAAKKSAIARKNGKNGGNPSLCNNGENQPLVKGMVKGGVKPRSQIPDAREKREAKASPKKASRLSPDWVLPKSWGEWAISMISERSVRLEADKFRDYWTSKAGKDAAKLDWEATWRNWVRSAAERQSNLPKQSPDPKSERRAFIEKFTRQIQ